MGRWINRDLFGEGVRIGIGAQRDPGGVGHFIGRDQVDTTIQYADGMNLYLYVRSTPTSMLDPTGQITLFLRPTPILRPAPVLRPNPIARPWWRPRPTPYPPIPPIQPCPERDDFNECQLIGSAPRQKQREVRCTYDCGDGDQREIKLPWPPGTKEPTCPTTKEFWIQEDGGINDWPIWPWNWGSPGPSPPYKDIA